RFDCDWSSDVCSSDLPSVATILPTSFPTTSGRAFTAPYSTSGFGIPFGNQCTISTSCSLRTSMSCSRRSRVIGCCSISAVDPLLLSVATLVSPFGVDERPQTAERSPGSGRRITSHGRSYLRLVEGHMPQQRCRTAHATPSAAPREHAPEPLRSQAKMERNSRRLRRNPLYVSGARVSTQEQPIANATIVAEERRYVRPAPAARGLSYPCSCTSR